MATYINRERQRIIAAAVDTALKTCNLPTDKEDELLFAVFDALSKSNGRPAQGFAKWFNLDLGEEK